MQKTYRLFKVNLIIFRHLYNSPLRDKDKIYISKITKFGKISPKYVQ